MMNIKASYQFYDIPCFLLYITLNFYHGFYFAIKLHGVDIRQQFTIDSQKKSSNSQRQII